MAQNKQATPDELEARHAIIGDLIALGYSQADVVNTCLEKYPEWDIGPRQIRNYYTAVFDELATEAFGINRAALFTLTLKRLTHLFKRALDANNDKLATEIAMNISKLGRVDRLEGVDWRKAALEAGFNPADVVAAFLSDKQGVNDAIE